MKNNAKPVKNIIPDMLRPFTYIEGCDSFGKNLPITNLWFNTAIIGATRKDKVVAKSTNSFSLSPNCITIKIAPIASMQTIATYDFLESSDSLFLNNWIIFWNERE